MLKIFSFSLIIISCISQIAPSQTLEWHRHFSLNNNATGNKLTIGTDGYIYVVGSSGHDQLLLKYSSSGNLIWSKTYNPGGTNCSAKDIVYKNNYLYITGYTSVNSIRSLTTIKCDTSGNMLWIKDFLGSDNSYYHGASIALDSNQNIIVTGSVNTASNGFDIVTIKYDNNGNQLWFKVIDGSGHLDDYSNGLILDPMGNTYIVNTSRVVGFPPIHQFLTCKYNQSGEIQWLKTYGSNMSTYAMDITLDDSLNIIVTGGSNSNYGTVKYDTMGNIRWIKTYSGPTIDPDRAFSVTYDKGNNIYVTGIISNNYLIGRMGTIKYNYNGLEQWVRIYDGPGNYSDCGLVIKSIDNDGVYIIGISSNHLLLHKYDTTGNTIFSTTYNYSDEDTPNDFIVDSFKNIYIVGQNVHPGQGYNDLLLIKYSQTTGIEPISSEIPDKFSLTQNYPNPFNPVTNIKFDIPKSSFTSIKVYDALGREISALVNEELKAGKYETSWNASAFPSGIYFYKLISANFTDTKKMVLIK